MDIRLKSLELLYRPPLDEPILRPECWDAAPLTFDLERLARPDAPLEQPDVLRLLVKFFHAYVHDSQRDSLSLAEATLLFEQFTHRRHGCAALQNRLELRQRLLSLGFALCMVADLPRSAALLQDILTRAPVRDADGGTFLGLDIGTGTGVLLLAVWLLARRRGFTRVELLGLERNTPVAARSDALLGDLRIGRVLTAEAKSPETYDHLPDGPLDFVANETLPSQGHSLWKEDFLAINQALFARLGQRLTRTEFFPSAVLATDRHGRLRVRLTPANRFTPDTDYPAKLLLAQGIELQGRPMSLDAVGTDWRGHIPEAWLPRLAHRW